MICLYEPWLISDLGNCPVPGTVGEDDRLGASAYRGSRQLGATQEMAMKIHYTIALSMLAGVAIGGTAIQTLHAQAKPPVYMVAINEISNQEGYTKQYLPTAQKTLKEHGGIYVAAGPGTQIDGSFPKGRVVILRWESIEALNGWRHSPEYEAIRKVGEGFAKYNVVAVDGVKP
jgi:uncharacterized protein (DUF1330 family)